jgi:hypothetical protein
MLQRLCCVRQEEWRGEIEQLSWKPRAFLVKGFLSEEECNHIKDMVSLAPSEQQQEATAGSGAAGTVQRCILGRAGRSRVGHLVSSCLLYLFECCLKCLIAPYSSSIAHQLQLIAVCAAWPQQQKETSRCKPGRGSEWTLLAARTLVV